MTVTKNLTPQQYKEDLQFKIFILEAQQEAALDGILVVDTNRRVVSFNKKFVEMWQIPANIIATRDDNKFIQSVLDKLRHPEKFTEKIEKLMLNLEQESDDELYLKDGRCFARYSKSIQDVNNIVRGRVWFFRDITELKRAQRDLKRHRKQLEKSVQKRTAELEKLYLDLYQQEKKNEELNRQLEQANLGLQSLVTTLEEEKRHVEKMATAKYKDALQPLIDMLLDTHPLSNRQQEILTIINEILNDLTSPINHHLSQLPSPLSSTETKVANCIKLDRSTHEIAETLCCSRRTVEGHRLSIRRKLKLRPGEDLRSILFHIASQDQSCDFQEEAYR